MKRIAYILIAIALIGLFIYVYLPGYTRYQELRAKNESLLTRLKEVEIENKRIKKEMDLLENDMTHVEKVLRDDMGLVKPGEVIYKVVEDVRGNTTAQQVEKQD